MQQEVKFQISVKFNQNLIFFAFFLDHDNQDTMSERDFICPPKRRKQEIELTTITTPSSTSQAVSAALSAANKLDFIPTSSLFSQLLNPSAHSENGIYENYFMKQNDLR
jgi:hypothetical protein